MKGILLIAVGSEAYGQWAFNQALSIKHHSPGLPIQLLCESNTIRNIPHFPFDIIHDVGDVCRQSHTGNFEPAELKLNLNAYSVFKETIYLDADGITIRDLKGLFDICSLHGEFAGQVIGYVTQTQGKEAMLWATPDKLWSRFGLKNSSRLPALNTSFMYWKKGETAERIFNQAYENYRNNLEIGELDYKWGQSGAQPDELYMNLALCQTETDAHLPVTPIYFRTTVDSGKPVKLEELRRTYWGLGCWGDRAYNHISIVKYYDAEMNDICSKLSMNHNYRFDRLIRKKFFRNPLKLKQNA